ncbi:bacillithiol system redox-active protein YtxJ [Flavobacterium psychrotolerans]|uniref:Bacillithiol system redox-active protein YtxJ n=1 Tax=Flavobacterium psychrotolerans TaxID=2169410 RepID=A0A2U1JK68_9FLAO|nr:bacillithiol system redox-active protein YtxJ [Flavobacterium psychrotolerans]PWA05384.1 bacillithiol system redox-active protein YtxJ [Flavobacterium psychrotolerans]
MGIFSTIFGESENQNISTGKITWIPLTDLDQLNEIVTFSDEKPIIIFKHSTRCSVSRMALKQFENEFDSANEVNAYFLDLIARRDISNEIAHRFEVVHQSPQLLLIKSGKSVYDVSHSAIDAVALKTWL